MLYDNVPQYAALLRQQYLFHGLDDAQLAHVVTRFEPTRYDGGALIITEGAPGEDFFIIFEGKVRITKLTRLKERQLDILGPGDYFGEEALLFDRPRSASVTAVEPVLLLRLGRDQFFEILQDFPSIRMNLSATAESRHLAHNENFDWLGTDEVIYLIVRKHEFFLLLALLGPIFLGLVSIPVIVFGFTFVSTPFVSKAVDFAGIVFMVGAISWGIWNWKDWGNDYYIVTNQRVVWLERIIGLYYSRREAPLTTILSVKQTSSQIGRLLDYGNVNVRTFTGGIMMRNMTHPNLFVSFVEGFQVRARYQLKAQESAAMERSLRKRMGLPVEGEPVKIETPKPWDHPKRRNAPTPDSLRDKLSTFLQVRYERGGVITYRKHWLLLVRKVWLPTLVQSLLLGITLYLIISRALGSGISIPLSGLPAITLWMMWFIGGSLWWLYQYVDWSNDIYQLTPEQIVDIERKPLGAEDKKTASLDSILSLEHTRNGVIQLLFNYGNVTINVGEAKFLFRGVYNPDQVHQDVADYMEARVRKRREGEAARERERMVDWLVTYHRQVDSSEDSENEADWDLFPR
jgi:hypothetical protein